VSRRPGCQAGVGGGWRVGAGRVGPGGAGWMGWGRGGRAVLVGESGFELNGLCRFGVKKEHLL
jgi:hypothetical protein